MTKRICGVLSLLLCLAAPLLADEAGASAALERVRHSPLELRRFVEAMPKGGDLHNHLSGAAYAESFVTLAAQDGLCIDKTTYKVQPAPCDGTTTVPAGNALTDSVLYQHVLDTMSMRQFRPTFESGHDHFFRTFGAFGNVSWLHMPDMLKEVVNRFAAENVDYVETILSPDHGDAADLGKKLPPNLTFAQMRDALLKDGVPNVVAESRKGLDDAEAKLGPTKSVVRYIYEVHRGGSREAVFAEMVVGFELATADPRVVAVNPVAAEDGWSAMVNFEEQMRMFAYLRSLYPKVALTMHAGELAPGLVPPETLRFHIHDSIAVAGARRIGHGVDIMRETGAETLLKLMASKPVPVEICLTSNDLILGVRGKDHPMRTYMKHGVPIVLASDDPGVSRGDLSTEFQRAVEEQGATYKELKEFARNSIQWSFLEGNSLWKDRTYGARVSECTQPQSATCRTFLQQNPKAAQEWRLEERLREFEAQY